MKLSTEEKENQQLNREINDYKTILNSLQEHWTQGKLGANPLSNLCWCADEYEVFDMV